MRTFHQDLLFGNSLEQFVVLRVVLADSLEEEHRQTVSNNQRVGSPSSSLPSFTSSTVCVAFRDRTEPESVVLQSIAISTN